MESQGVVANPICTDSPPHYFNDECFADLDAWVKSATDAGLWVILAVRGEYVAGQLYASEPGSVVFRNETLQQVRAPPRV